MSIPLLMVRNGLVLRPADDLAAEDMLALREGKHVLVTALHPRSVQHHRLLFALLRKVAESTPTRLNEHALRSYVTMKAGHTVTLPLAFGQSYQAPASIAFDKMDQPTFRAFFDRVVEVILTDIAPNLPDSFADEFLAMLETPSSTPEQSRRPARASGEVVEA